MRIDAHIEHDIDSIRNNGHKMFVATFTIDDKTYNTQATTLSDLEIMIKDTAHAITETPQNNIHVTMYLDPSLFESDEDNDTSTQLLEQELSQNTKTNKSIASTESNFDGVIVSPFLMSDYIQTIDDIREYLLLALDEYDPRVMRTVVQNIVHAIDHNFQQTQQEASNNT